MIPTSSTLNSLLLHQQALNICLCSLLITLDTASLLTVAQTQNARDYYNPLGTVERNTYAPALSSISRISIGGSISPRPPPLTTNDPFTTTSDSLYATRPNGYVQPNTSQQPARQPISLKFTLIAGKFWKFNIKQNSLQSRHSEKELRLHRNISSNNFIIDDDGWFQYNFQQQQLFAWPSYYVKPAIYYFVLLPSGLDYEADGENIINGEDIVANIVVELMRPLISSKLDLEQTVDHKFSLEHLRRYSGYPLLLTQIVTIFDIFSQNSVSGFSSDNYSSNFTPTSHSSASTITSTSSAAVKASISNSIVQSKQGRYTSRLAEFLLIDSHSTPDGEYFSITWTTHPSLVNGTLSPINDCRLSIINDTVSKLSGRSLLYPDTDDKFVIPFSLEGPLVDSQAIIPTERGNYALKLILNTPCRRRTIIEELGVASAPGVYIGLPADIDDRENSVLDQQEASLNASKSFSSIITNSPVTTSTIEASQSTAVTTNYESKLNPKPELSTTSRNISGGNSQETESAYNTRQSTHNSHLSTTTEQSADLQTPAISISPALTQSTTVLTSTSSKRAPFAIEPNLNDSTFQSISNTRRALDASSTHIPANQQSKSKLQPQAKSYINFLDSFDTKINSVMAANATSSSMAPNDLSTSITATPSPSNITTDTSTLIPGKNGQESSLNDDLIGILNEVMEFLVSIAVPLSVILGLILISSILAAICSLCIKRRKSKQFEVGDRFKFRYGSERKGFLKKSSKPVILEADQKSLSTGGTPLHKPFPGKHERETDNMVSKKTEARSKQNEKSKKSVIPRHDYGGGSNFFAMSHMGSNTAGPMITAPAFVEGSNCGGGGGYSGGVDFGGGCGDGGGCGNGGGDGGC